MRKENGEREGEMEREKETQIMLYVFFNVCILPICIYVHRMSA